MTTRHFRGITSLLLTGLALCTLLGTSSAAVIDLSSLLKNPSFEGGVTANGCPIDWTCSGSPAPGAGAYTPTSSQYTPGSDGLSGGKIVPDGTHAAFSPSALAGSGTLKQVTSFTWAAGNTYTFTFWIGLPNTNALDGLAAAWPAGAVRVMVLADGVGGGMCGGDPCQMDLASPGLGQWKQIIYSFTPTQAFGQTIGVAFFESTGTNHQTVNYDIVGAQVDTRGSLVPEPATLLLLAVGLGSFGLARRRRSTVNRKNAG